ncbi:MAG TPA: AgmX/PglI C-terminal domain-containing protein [Nitrospiria bacterium]|nr:AgmX/PglI C-terminal domain-containing protein [Nitrospiria bacterium]
MAAISELSGPEYSLPPDRFTFILVVCLAVYGFLGLSVGWFPVEPAGRGSIHDLSPRVAKLIAPPKPPPPVPVVKPEEAPPPEAVEEEPEPVPEEEAPPEPVLTPEEMAEEQRKKNLEVAMNSGLLKVLKKNEQTLKTESPSQKKIEKVFSETGKAREKTASPAGLGMDPSKGETAGIDDIVSDLKKTLPSSGGTGISGRTKSGGIDKMLSGLLEAPEESVLKERKTAAVESPFQMKGTAGGVNLRSYESIAEVVESYKGSLHFIYNKALRTNPTLRGTVTIEFILAPSGGVLECRVASTTMDDPEFEEALVKRVLGWKFPAVEEGEVTITYPLVFSISG